MKIKKIGKKLIICMLIFLVAFNFVIVPIGNLDFVYATDDTEDIDDELENNGYYMAFKWLTNAIYEAITGVLVTPLATILRIVQVVGVGYVVCRMIWLGISYMMASMKEEPGELKIIRNRIGNHLFASCWILGAEAIITLIGRVFFGGTDSGSSDAEALVIFIGNIFFC